MLLQALLRPVRRDDGRSRTPQRRHQLRPVLLHVPAVPHHVRAPAAHALRAAAARRLQRRAADHLRVNIQGTKNKVICEIIDRLLCCNRKSIANKKNFRWAIVSA